MEGRTESRLEGRPLEWDAGLMIGRKVSWMASQGSSMKTATLITPVKPRCRCTVD